MLVGLPLLGCQTHVAECPAVAESDDPFKAMSLADLHRARHQHSEALTLYLWALDHGVDVNPSFFATRNNDLLERVGLLAGLYPPARDALVQREEVLTNRILRAAEAGTKLDPEPGGTGLYSMDLDLFLNMALKLGDEPKMWTVYQAVSAHRTVDDPLRRALWIRMERRFVDSRQYSDAVRERDVALGAVRADLEAFKWVTPDIEVAQPIWRQSVEWAIENEGGVHFEALLGGGLRDDALAFAEELVKFRPRASTFGVLIRHARRAGADAEAQLFWERASAQLPVSERRSLGPE